MTERLMSIEPGCLCVVIERHTPSQQVRAVRNAGGDLVTVMSNGSPEQITLGANVWEVDKVLRFKASNGGYTMDSRYVREQGLLRIDGLPEHEREREEEVV